MKPKIYRRANPDFISRIPVDEFVERIEEQEHGQIFPHDLLLPFVLPHGKLGGTRAFDRENPEWHKLGRRRYKVCRHTEHVECTSQWGALAFTYPERKAA